MSDSQPFPLIPDNKGKSFSGARRAVRDALRLYLPMQVYGQLLDNGWSREWAAELVREVEMRDNPSGTLAGAEAHRMAALAQVWMIVGALLFATGSAITVFSLMSAFLSSGGGVVILAYGAILTGALLFARGLKASRQYPRRPLPGRNFFEESGAVRPDRNPNDPY